MPQGTLIERVRAGGAGLAAFYTPTGVGTDGRRRARRSATSTAAATSSSARSAPTSRSCARYRADRAGNLVYRRGARNFNPAFATAARVTIAEVDEIVESGALDPETIVTPAIFVDRVVQREQPFDAGRVRELSRRYGKKCDLEVARARESARAACRPI